MKEKVTNRLKFYADTPMGPNNKFFVFSVTNYEHAIDLAAKFVQEKGFVVRAAYYENQNGLSIRFDKLFDLSTWTNSITEEENRNRLLKKLTNKLKDLSINNQ